MEIREKQIEDILVSSPALMKKTFGLDEEPRLIGRQIIVPSGRLDMLYTYQKDLFLIELKVASFQKRFIKQVLDYKTDLQLFQKQGKLINGDIVPFLLMPQTSKSNRDEIEAKGIVLQEYNPEEILRFFYSERLRPITTFSELKPVDVGIWNIHLINKFIYDLSETNSIKELRTIAFTLSKTSYPVPLEQLEQYFAIYSGKSLEWQTPRAKMYGAKMYSNYAIDLGLLAKNDTSVYLTPEGFKFVIQMQLHKSLKLMNYLNIN